jgi:hypothetical protein
MVGWRILFDVVFYGSVNCIGVFNGPSFYGASLISHPAVANESQLMAFPTICQENNTVLFYGDSAPSNVESFGDTLSYYTSLNGAVELELNRCYSDLHMWSPFHPGDTEYSVRLVPRVTAFLCDDTVSLSALETSQQPDTSEASTAEETTHQTTPSQSSEASPEVTTSHETTRRVHAVASTQTPRARPRHDTSDHTHTTSEDDTAAWVLLAFLVIFLLTFVVCISWEAQYYRF